jgi:hypothetical protein
LFYYPIWPEYMETKTVDTITQAYLECALWADLSDEDGNPLDEYGISDIAPETLAQAVSDVSSFLAACDSELGKDWRECWDDEQIGHDFWLTRNRHGAGFWDRDLPYCMSLSNISNSFDELSLYVGDDNLIYFA